MLLRLGCLALLTQLCAVPYVETAQQKVMLSDSYLPVVMQVIAHLVDQMAYETKDEPSTARPTSTPRPTTTTPRPTTTTAKAPAATTPVTNRPAYEIPQRPGLPWKPQQGGGWSMTVAPTSTPRPTTTTPRPTTTTAKAPAVTTPVTNRPAYQKPQRPGLPWKPQQGGGWSMAVGVSLTTQTIPAVEATTPYHRPGLYAPERPPKPNERLNTKPQYILLPVENDAEEYTVIKPQNQKDANSFLSPETHSIVKPIVEGLPVRETLLPPETYEPLDPHLLEDEYAISRAAEDSTLELAEDELNENNLQYISTDLREMLKLAHDPNDERAFDINDEGLGKATPPKQKLSHSNLRMLLLYDLLSREAKRQKLSDFGGFSESVIREISEAGSGGARSQFGYVLARMLERKDCQHDYANNRAKEMVAELKKDESLLSSEIRYLQPLVYRL